MKNTSNNPIKFQPRIHQTNLRTRTYAIRWLGVMAGAAFMFIGSSALAQLKVEFAPEYYYWQENANGTKLFDESGPRYGLDLSYKQQIPDEGWLWAARFEFYYGHLDYNGQTQGGTPINTTSDYYGGYGELRFGYRWSWTENQFVDLMGGAGVEDWERSLNGQGGYDENWLPFYLKAGLELSPEETGWIGALGVKVPVYTVQTVDMSRIGGGTVTLYPGTEPSLYAEAGYQFTKRLSAVAFFDSYWFAKSSPETSGGVQFYQPESKSYRVGVKFGWAF